MSDRNNPSGVATPPPPVPGSYKDPGAPTPSPAPAKSALTLWAIIVAIAAIVSAIIPGLSFVAWVPALGATIFGIVGLVSKRPGRGKAITAVILGPIALLVAIIVSVGTIVAGISSASSSPADSVSEIAEEQEPAEDPVEEVMEEPATIPADIVYSGTGDSILAIELPDGADQASVATLGHSGSSNFAVWELDAAMTQTELAVNTIGAYQGTVLLNNSRSATTSLEITADGAWTVTLRSILSVRQFAADPITGTGDDVVVYTGGAAPAEVVHDGQRNFAVWSYGAANDLVVNEIGPYTGTVRWGEGNSIIVITADGNWSIAVG